MFLALPATVVDCVRIIWSLTLIAIPSDVASRKPLARERHGNHNTVPHLSSLCREVGLHAAVLDSHHSEADVKEWVWVIEKLQAHLHAESSRPRAGSDANVRSGYLYKKGAKRRNWKRRSAACPIRMSL